MQSLNLGSVEDFPFLEAPPKRAIADGYQLLNELGATDGENALTTIGRELARLPLDPRIGRMILEARGREALREVLVVASALSVQDVRDRPLEQQQAADQAHAKFDDEKSEFLGTLKLWSWLEHSRGGHGEHRLSRRKHEQLLRDNFISPRRVREWRDIHAQLQSVVTEHGWRVNASRADLRAAAPVDAGRPARQHRRQERRGRVVPRRARHPLLAPSGRARLAKKPGRWIVAAELVETTRLYARGIAAIDPRWLPQLAAHLIKTQLLEPHWEKKAGAGDRARARDAVRHRHLREPARRLRDRRPGRGARDLHPRGARRRRVGDEAAVRRGQPQADRAGRGARAQVAAPGRPRRRRPDLRLLRPAGAGRRAQRRIVRALVPARGQAPAPAAHADPRGADAPRGRRHHDGGVPEDDPPRRRRLRGPLPPRAGQRARRRDGDACRSSPSTRPAKSGASGSFRACSRKRSSRWPRPCRNGRALASCRCPSTPTRSSPKSSSAPAACSMRSPRMPPSAPACRCGAKTSSTSSLRRTW